MAKLTDEALAGIRLLVCMARADGVLKPDEKFALEDALAGAKLPENVTVASLLQETWDPLVLARVIQSPEARDYTYASVFSLAYCDRELAAAENAILNTLRTEWHISPEEEGALQKALEIGSQPDNPNEALPLTPKGAAEQKKSFDSLLTRYCFVTGLTGAIPVPLVPDLLIVPMQMKMVQDVGILFGHTMDKGSMRILFETLGVGTGARIGITALCKLVPGFGSVVGAASSFATTYALGKVAWMYFESDRKAKTADLKAAYREQHAAGKKEYEKQKAALHDAHDAHGGKLKQLAYDLQAGKITPAEYQKKMDEMN